MQKIENLQGSLEFGIAQLHPQIECRIAVFEMFGAKEGLLDRMHPELDVIPQIIQKAQNVLHRGVAMRVADQFVSSTIVQE